MSALPDSRGTGVDFVGSIDRASPVPYYFQLRRLLEEQILSGRWKPGDRIPSEPVLSGHFGLARPTVRQALNALEQEGLIRKEKGRGAFVARAQPGSWLLQSSESFFEDEVGRGGVHVESTVIRAEVETLPAWAAQLLRVTPGSAGVTLERVRRVDGQVAMYVVNHLPEEYANVVLALAEKPNTSLYAELREVAGVRPAGSTRMLEAVPARENLARLLEVPSRFPLVNIESVTWDATLQPFDCYRAWLRTDRTRIVVESHTRPAGSGAVIKNSLVSITSRADGA